MREILNRRNHPGPKEEHCSMRIASSKTSWICCFGLFIAAFILLSIARTVVNSAEQGPSGVPLPVFTDVTQQAGLNMTIYNGDDTTVYLMDINGTGACF